MNIKIPIHILNDEKMFIYTILFLILIIPVFSTITIYPIINMGKKELSLLFNLITEIPFQVKKVMV